MSIQDSGLTVPAYLIEPIKQGLIALGYANENTPASFVQDCYIKWVLVNQTGFNPNMPYSLCLLPKKLREELNVTGCGGGIDPEPDLYQLISPNAVDYTGLIASILSGAWQLNSPLFPTPSTDIHNLDQIAFRQDSRGLVVDIKDPTIVALQNGTRVVTSKSIPVLVEVHGFTDAIYDDLINGDSDLEVYFNNGTANWSVMNPSQLQTFLKKNNVNGKYYFVFGTNTLDVVPPSNLNQVAIDEDGEGNKHEKYTGTLNLNFGEILEVPNTGITLKSPTASVYMQLADAIKSNAWVLDSPILPDQTIVYGSETLSAHDSPDGVVFDVLVSSAVNNNGPDFASLKSVVPILIEVVGLDDQEFDKIIAGTSAFQLSSQNGGVWTVLPSEMIPMVLKKYPTNGKFYVVTSTNLLYKERDAQPAKLGIDQDGEGTEFERQEAIADLLCGTVAEPVGEPRFTIPNKSKVLEMNSLIRSGSWNAFAGITDAPLLDEADFDLTITDNISYIKPLNMSKFTITDTEVSTSYITPAYICIQDLTDEGANKILDGTTNLELYAGDSRANMQKVPTNSLNPFLKKNPVDNKWYYVISTNYFFFREPNYFYALGVSGEALAGDALLVTTDNYGDPSVKPSVPVPISIDYLTAQEIKNFNRSVGDGDITVPNLDQNDILWYDKYVLEDSEAGYDFNVAGHVDLEDFLSVYKGNFALINNGKKLITTIFKLQGLTDDHVSKLLAFNDPNVYFKMLNGENEIDIPQELHPMMQNFFTKVGDLWYFAMPSLNVVRDNVFPVITHIDGVSYRPNGTKPISIELAPMTLGLFGANDVGNKHLVWSGSHNVLDPDNGSVGITGYEAYCDLTVGTIAKLNLTDTWANNEDIIIDLFMCPIRSNSGDTTKENALHIGTISNLPRDTGQSLKLEFNSITTGYVMAIIDPVDGDAHFLRYLNFSLNRTNYETQGDVIVKTGDRMLVIDYQNVDQAKVGQDVNATVSIYYQGNPESTNVDFQAIPETHTRLVAKVRTSSTETTLRFDGLELPSAN